MLRAANHGNKLITSYCSSVTDGTSRYCSDSAHRSISLVTYGEPPVLMTVGGDSSFAILSLAGTGGSSTPLTGRAVKPQHQGHIGGPIAQP